MGWTHKQYFLAEDSYRKSLIGKYVEIVGSTNESWDRTLSPYKGKKTHVTQAYFGSYHYSQNSESDVAHFLETGVTGYLALSPEDIRIIK